jgi:pre-mRNA-processing factor 39
MEASDTNMSGPTTVEDAASVVETTALAEKPAVEEATPVVEATPQEVAAAKVAADVAALKEKLADDPSDFSTWTGLLKLLEKDDMLPMDDICKTYDAFFAEFPLCFGFWNKYADVVKRRQATQENVHLLVCGIYERGTAACYHSVEMWVKYIGYLESAGAPVEDRRAIFQRAMTAVEGDTTANAIWEKAIKFEYGQFNFTEVTNVYKRLFATGCCGCASQTKAGYPFQATSYMNKYFTEFRSYATSQTLSTLASEAEIEELKSQVEPNHPASSATAESVADLPVEAEEIRPKTEDEVMEEVRGKIITEVEEVGQKTNERLTTRTKFEGSITRSYFHTKPLHSVKNGKIDDKELANWREYLDYEQKHGDAKSTEKLYERCLVPLANYSEFWIRYSQWAEVQKGVKEGLAVIERATTIFLKRRADVHMHRALLLEVQGDTEGARKTFEHILTAIAPGHLESMIKVANFERRQGNFPAVVKAYEDAISCGGDSTRPFLSMQLARFQEKNMQDVDSARATYKAAVGTVRSNKNLWLGYIQFEFGHTQTDFFERVLSIFNDALGQPGGMSEEDQQDLWLRKLDLVEDYSPDVRDLGKAKLEFTEWQSR